MSDREISDKNNYTFAYTSSSTSRRDTSKNDHDRMVFCSRLEMLDATQMALKPEYDADDTLRRLLDEFIITHHANIWWYGHRIKREQRVQRWYMVFTIALLVLLPTTVFLLSNTANEHKTTAVFTAQITAVLTSLIAIHRIISSFFDKRKVMGIFHKASSSLKEATFTFESTWKNPVARLEELKSALVAQNALSRLIVKGEQDGYFEMLDHVPSIDLAQMLKSAGQDAVAVAAQFASPAMAAREKKHADVTAKANEINIEITKLKEYEVQLDKAKEELNKADPAPSDADKANLKTEIDSLESKIKESRITLAVKRRELANLG